MAVQRNYGGVPQAFGAGPKGAVTGGTPDVPAGRLISGLAPWLTQAQGTTQMSTGGAAGAGATATSGTPWYQSAMQGKQSADAAALQTQRDEIAQQKALAEQIRAQKAADEAALVQANNPGAYFDEASQSWLVRPSVYEGRSGDE